MGSPHVQCGDLVTGSDLYSPLTLYGMQELCNCQWLMLPIPYMECYCPSYLMDCGNLVMGSPHMYDMICMWEPCNCQWLMVPLTLYEMWESCNCQWLMVCLCLIWNVGTVSDSYASPIPYMECGNLVTVSDWWSPIPYMGLIQCLRSASKGTHIWIIYGIWSF